MTATIHHYLHCTDNTNLKEDTLTNCNGNERYCEIFIGLTALLTTTSAIATAITVVLSWKFYNQHKKKGDLKKLTNYVATLDIVLAVMYISTLYTGEVLSPIKQHFNADNIEMQSSPAYVPFSQDNKASSAIAEYEIVQAPVD